MIKNKKEDLIQSTFDPNLLTERKLKKEISKFSIAKIEPKNIRDELLYLSLSLISLCLSLIGLANIHFRMCVFL